MPNDLTSPAMLYLALYVATWVLHVMFVHYVVAGVGYLAICASLPGGRLTSPTATVLRDWMPLMLSGAITAGVAPLLFIQILYQHQFYTANLLLFHRWMGILPALIAAFYLCYLMKREAFAGWPLLARAAVAWATLACLGFVGWSWTENHLLSLAQDDWVEMYSSGAMVYQSRQLAPRLLFWLAISPATMAVVLGWQHWYRGEAATRLVATLALASLTFAAPMGIWWVTSQPAEIDSESLGPAPRALLWFALSGLIAQTVAWGVQLVQARFVRGWLIVASIASAVWLTVIAMRREFLRLEQVDLAAMMDRSQAAVENGGLVIFLIFCTLNTALIGLCFWLVRRGWVETE